MEIKSDFKQIISKHRAGNVYVLDSANQFIKLEWSFCLAKIMQIASLIENETGREKQLFAILHPDSFTWDLCNFALKLMDMALIGINHFDNPDQIKQLLCDAPVDYLITSASCLDQVKEYWTKTIIVLDFQDNYEPTIEFQKLPRKAIKNTTLIEDTCEIITSSGTTGKSKIYSYSQDQIISAIDVISAFYKDELLIIHNTISWMPLANPFQRILNLVSIVNNKSLYYVNNPKDIVEYCSLAKADYLASIPRFYEKILEALQFQLSKTGVFSRYFKFVLSKLTQGNLSQMDKLRVLYLHQFLGSKIKKKLGGEIKFLLSGSAPLSSRVDYFYRNIGLPIYQAYGMSEDIIPICLSNSKANKPGSVGKVINPNQVQLKNGLVCVKSTGLYLEFLTRNQQDYLVTGDLAEIDEEGYLFLKGRESDFFKLSTGRKIFPLKIESCLKAIFGVNFACVFGAGRKTLWAVLDVNEQFQENLGNEASIKQSILHALRSLNSYEIPTQFIILKNTFSINSGEITGNIKVKRKFIENKYTAYLPEKTTSTDTEIIIKLEPL
jgi:long-chain acyl-CoA synthetase